MASKSDFTVTEWEMLRDAPHLVALSVAIAGGSGIVGSLKEAMAPAMALVEAAKGDNVLLREICQPDEMKASQSGLRSRLKITDIDTLRSELKNAALQGAQGALELLRQKGFNEDVSIFRNFLWDIGNRVAQAAKEGGFLGFGGERVSENERALLSDLSDALETAQT